MKKLACFLVFVTVCLLATPVLSADKTGGTSSLDYIIGPGDILDISVWKNEDLTKMVIVLPDGKISFPLIGEVMASNKTVGQLKAEIERKLIRYIPDPILSVIIKQVNSMLIYVIGKVQRPGRFELNTNVNILQALTMAGGLNPFAKKDKIRVLREEKGGTITLNFDYDDVAINNKLKQNVLLKRGDVIVVP